MREGTVLFLLLALSAVIRFTVITVLSIEPVSDSLTYMTMTRTMLDTGHMDDGMGNVAFYSSGYPLFLVPFFALFGDTPAVVQVVNALLGVGSVLLVYLCGRWVLPDWRWAMVPALLWAFYPPAILYTEYVAKENLLIVVFLLQVLMLLQYSGSPRGGLLALLLGLVFGVGLLTGPAILLTGLVIVVVVAELDIRRPGAMRWGRVLVFVLGCALALTPWLSYTNAKLGAPVLNNNGKFNLYLGNNPAAEVYLVGIQHTPLGPRWAELRTRGEVAAFSYLADEAVAYILTHPGRTLWLGVGRLIRFWRPPVHEGKGGNQSTLETLVRLAWLVCYSFIFLTALLPLVFFRRLQRSHWILCATILLYWALHGAAFVLFRFRLTTMPIVCLMSACGLYFLYQQWRTRAT